MGKKVVFWFLLWNIQLCFWLQLQGRRHHLLRKHLAWFGSLGFPPCLQRHKAKKENIVEMFESFVEKIYHTICKIIMWSQRKTCYLFFSKCVILACQWFQSKLEHCRVLNPKLHIQELPPLKLSRTLQSRHPLVEFGALVAVTILL